ncbi:MAG: LysM peptidoglycan-binding domain-containing protein [Spirochaetota bacterium]
MQVGVELADGRVVTVLNGGGARGSALFTTTADGQTRALFQVFCRPTAHGCLGPGAGGGDTGHGAGGGGAAGCDTGGKSWRFVRGMMIDGIPPGPAGKPELRLTVWRDAGGTLKMSVRETLSGLHSGELSLGAPSPEGAAGARIGASGRAAGAARRAPGASGAHGTPIRQTGAPGVETAGISPKGSPGAYPEAGAASAAGVREGADARRASRSRRAIMPAVIVVLILCAAGAVLFLLLPAGEGPPGGEKEPPAVQAGTGERFLEDAADPGLDPAPTTSELGGVLLTDAEGETGAGEERRPGAGEETDAARKALPRVEEHARAAAEGRARNVETPAEPSAGKEAAEAYRIRPGDTMWDLSGRFYGDPLLYPSLARYNRIYNPDLIISGDSLLLPPRMAEQGRR